MVSGFLKILTDGRDIYAAASTRWADPCAQPLNRPAWETARGADPRRCSTTCSWLRIQRSCWRQGRHVTGRIGGNTAASIDEDGRPGANHDEHVLCGEIG